MILFEDIISKDLNRYGWDYVFLKSGLFVHICVGVWDLARVGLMSGILSLGASDRLVKLIGAVYWFTVEFGLIKENGKMKFYGAGVASSVNEIENAMSNKDLRLLRLDIDKPPLDFVVQGIQPFFYYIER